MYAQRLLILPVIGLLLFGVVTYSSLRFNTGLNHSSGKYFWWSSIRLDSDPKNRHHRSRCEPGSADCDFWDPETIWIDPGWLAKGLVISALPAFAVGEAVRYVFARRGVSEVITFMVSTPLLIFTWYYLVSYLIARVARKWRAVYGQRPTTDHNS